jgi:hypothetical protein
MLLSRSTRFELRALAAYVKDLLGWACFWKWKYARLAHPDNIAHDILYLGRKDKREQALALLGIDGAVDADQVSKCRSSRRVFLGEIPSVGALWIPKYLSMVLPLENPLDEITASCSRSLRRLIEQQHAKYTTRKVLDMAEVEHIYQNMLEPFTTARHHDRASLVELDTVRTLVQDERGRLEVTYFGEEAVACELTCKFARARKRYCGSIRCGFPEQVYSDSKRLQEASAMSTYFSLKWAIENGAEYYDIGISLARPEGGVIQWKRKWNATLDSMGNHGYFFISLPKSGAAKFLWDAPLFAVEHFNSMITLHLGIPDGISDAEVAARYCKMGFGGLSKVYLYCERPLDETILDKFRTLYSSQKSPPVLQTKLVNK